MALASLKNDPLAHPMSQQVFTLNTHPQRSNHA